MSKVSARWVPQMLTDDQKRTQLDMSRYLLSRYEDAPGNFIERVVTQDETWFTNLTRVKNAEQTMEASWLIPPKKLKRSYSAGKVMPSIFCESQGLIMIDYFSARSHDIQCILCRQIEEATPGNRKKEARKTDSWCSALTGQRPCPHVMWI